MSTNSPFGWLKGDSSGSNGSGLETEKPIIEEENAFKTHITVRHLLYANKVVRTAKANEHVLNYTDVTRCKDPSQLHITVPCDSSLFSTDRGHAQQGQMVIVSGNQVYTPKQKSSPSSNPKRRTEVVTSCFSIGNLAHWRSARSKKVCTSTYAAELHSLEEGLDLGVVCKRIAENILSRPVRVIAQSDHLGMIQSIHSAAPSLKEKRLTVSLYSIKESLASDEIDDVGYIPGNFNPSDCLTKPKCQDDVSTLATESILRIPDKNVLRQKYCCAEKRKKYLFTKSGVL